eukprot:10427995-Karenia_brevis.AAC.1
MAPKSLEELDAIVSLFFDFLFHRGHSPEDGNKTFAAVKFYLTTLHPNQILAFPRVTRALRGWRKTTPIHQRLPLPWIV